MIYSPTFLGSHNYYKYNELKKELKIHLEKSELINIDLLHTTEYLFWFETIFCPIFMKKHITTRISSKDSKKLRKIRKLCKKFVFKTDPRLFKRLNKYCLEITN